MKDDENNTVAQRNFRDLKELNLIDDFLFGKLFQEADNEEILKELISTLVGHLIPDIVEFQKQHSINKDPLKKGVRLDAYVKDSSGKIYDIEVQIKPQNVQKRMRYYQCLMDSEQMPAGEYDYFKLPDSIIIFICDFDPFKRGWYKYEFASLCLQDTSLELGDGARKIVLSTKGKEQNDASTELIELLKFFKNTTDKQAKKSENHLIKKMNDMVKRIKENPKFGGEFMNLQEKIYHSKKEAKEEGKKEGKEEGKEEGKIIKAREIAKNLIAIKMSNKQISAATGLTIEEIEELKK